LSSNPSTVKKSRKWKTHYFIHTLLNSWKHFPLILLLRRFLTAIEKLSPNINTLFVSEQQIFFQRDLSEKMLWNKFQDVAQWQSSCLACRRSRFNPQHKEKKEIVYLKKKNFNLFYSYFRFRNI
jgi:hypothetical protein